MLSIPNVSPSLAVVAVTPQRKTGRLRNIDLLKGILVLLVIVGHALPGDMHQSVLKYITTVFRMPLLIGLSGYMFTYEKLKDDSPAFVFYKYWNRLVVPWILAVIFYLVLININAFPTFTIREAVKLTINALVFPSHHLWYIAGLLFWIVLTWVLAKWRVKLKHILIVSALLCPVLCLFHIRALEATHPVAKFIVFTLRPYYYFFFILGMYLKSRHAKPYTSTWHKYAVITLAAALLILYYFFNAYLYALLVIPFNALLLMLVLDNAKKEKFLFIGTLEWIGRNSLAVYLWHMVPILILASFVGRHKPYVFYSLVFITEIVLLFSIFIFSKISFVRNYFFGMK